MNSELVPRPRVGQIVTLKNGHQGEVMTVIRGAHALRGKGEVEMMLLASTMQSEYGVTWYDVYYEANVQLDLPDAPIVVVTPRDVVSAKDQS